MVARFVRDEEAAGSNPVTPTRPGAASATPDRLLSRQYSSEVQQRSRATRRLRYLSPRRPLHQESRPHDSVTSAGVVCEPTSCNTPAAPDSAPSAWNAAGPSRTSPADSSASPGCASHAKRRLHRGHGRQVGSRPERHQPALPRTARQALRRHHRSARHRLAERSGRRLVGNRPLPLVVPRHCRRPARPARRGRCRPPTAAVRAVEGRDRQSPLLASRPASAHALTDVDPT